MKIPEFSTDAERDAWVDTMLDQAVALTERTITSANRVAMMAGALAQQTGDQKQLNAVRHAELVVQRLDTQLASMLKERAAR